MRVALIADLHANAPALAALAGDLAAADAAVCLGDLVGYYTDANETVEAVRAMGARCVLGNHDAFALRGCPPELPPAVRWGAAHAARALSAGNRAWLAGLPLVWGGEVGGRSLLLAHGSPWRPLTDYLYADTPAVDALGAFGFDVVALGQTHRALDRRAGDALVLNPGSVGQSRDRPAHACMMLLDTDTLAVERVARPYDPAPVIARARAEGAGEWITKHLA